MIARAFDLYYLMQHLVALISVTGHNVNRKQNPLRELFFGIKNKTKPKSKINLKMKHLDQKIVFHAIIVLQDASSKKRTDAQIKFNAGLRSIGCMDRFLSHFICANGILKFLLFYTSSPVTEAEENKAKQNETNKQTNKQKKKKKKERKTTIATTKRVCSSRIFYISLEQRF